jgi:hypothetical protein
MKKECEAASWWWAGQINGTIAPVLTGDQLITFQRTLANILEERYKNHWYPTDPDRGHGYRCIWFNKQNGIVDSVILAAARQAQIFDIKNRIHVDVFMWCDPGNVRIQYNNAPGKYHSIFEAVGDDGAKSPSLEFCRPKSLTQLETPMSNKQRSN